MVYSELRGVFKSAAACIPWACMSLLILNASNVFAGALTSSPAIVKDQLEDHYIAKIKLHTAAEITDLFDRAEMLLDQESSFALGQPIAFVLHGPEVEYFSRMNYGEYKSIVDKAAQLDAFQLIDVRVCASYLREHDISPSSLPPFVEVVPYGPEEERRLKAKGYQDF